MENANTTYYVVGGQYTYRVYGSTRSLHAAKLMATRHEEFHDNFAGWQKPDICIRVMSDRGDIVNYVPVYVWDRYSRKWEYQFA